MSDIFRYKKDCVSLSAVRIFLVERDALLRASVETPLTHSDPFVNKETINNGAGSRGSPINFFAS